MRLEGKVAAITGAASGMGKEIAILYAKEGANVVVSDIYLDAAKATVAEIESNGGIATALRVDVAKEEDIQTLIDTAVITYGTLDILVNNAGIMDNFVPASFVKNLKLEGELVRQVYSSFAEKVCFIDIKHTGEFKIYKDLPQKKGADPYRF